MTRTVLTWLAALVFTVLSAGLADAGARWPHCRPYTVETVCPPGHQLCRLKMVYARHQSPGYDASGYWYGVPRPSVLRHKVYKQFSSACGYRCWYKHPPRHGLPFGD